MRNTIYLLKGLFLSLTLVLAVSIILTFLVGHMVLTARMEVQARAATLTQLQSIFSTVQDAETGQRGFLLTTDRAYLEPYNDARADIRKQLEGLQQQVEKNQLSEADFADWSRLIEEKLAELQKTIDLAETNQTSAALVLLRTGNGKQLMDAIRQKFIQLQGQQQRLRALADHEAARATWFRTAMFVASAIINLIFLAWVYARIRREMSLQYVADLETERQREILSVTLASIGDAVIITDTHGTVTFLNKIAEDLTGWTIQDALDQPCAKVFHIINESSRQPVESPVDIVLKKGVVVGLANHTLLIRKDGSEVSIDDSGAPIRESNGAIRGVVLVFRDFSAHKETERLLIQAKENMEAANKAKDNFLAMLSHELRTPLTPVLATLSAWEAHRTLPPSVEPDLRLLRRNVEMEARLIDDLLDLTRIEHGKLSLEKETVDAHGLLDAVAALYRGDCASKSLHLSLFYTAKHSFVSADPSRLQQVFWNIVGNAVKFTPEGGAITITTANPRDGEFEVVIEDSGIGMSEEIMGRLYHRFEQGGPTAQRKSAGLGLGLSIAKALVTAHQGTLKASSKGPDQGASFIVNLPTTEAIPARSDVSTTPSPAAAGKSLRILLVEDHADTAHVMSSVLQSMGHTVEISGTVAAGLEQIDRQIFDLILSDLSLPDGTGIDFIRTVRKTHHTPAVALTGYGMAEDIEKCLRAGFDEHLTKPIDFEKLQNTVQKIARLQLRET